MTNYRLMDIKEIRKKKFTDLVKQLESNYVTLRKLRFGKSGASANELNEWRKTRKENARIKTVLNEGK